MLTALMSEFQLIFWNPYKERTVSTKEKKSNFPADVTKAMDFGRQFRRENLGASEVDLTLAARVHGFLEGYRAAYAELGLEVPQ